MIRIAAITCAFLGLQGAARADSIELRASVRLEAAGSVALGDVAVLDGPGAEALADVAVRIERGSRVTIDQVRAALEALPESRRPNWGVLTLAGSECAILPPAAAPAPMPAAPPATEAAADADSVRVYLSRRIGQILATEPGDLRLAFDDADRAFLDAPVGARTIEVRPVGASDRIPLSVSLYEGERLVTSRTIRVGVEIRRTVVIAAVAKRRGEVIGEGDVTTDTQWVGPAARPAAYDRVIGSAVRSRLQPGRAITDTDIQPPIAVEKGGIVSVHCLAGTVILRTQARATADARDGEVVRLQSLGERGRTFYARMDGPGRAITLTDAPPRDPSKVKWIGTEEGKEPGR